MNDPEMEDRRLLETPSEAHEDSQGTIYQSIILSRERLATVVTVFNKMIDDPEAVDGSMYDLPEWDDFLHLTRKLETSLKNCDGQAPITMTFIEWVTYSSYLSHVYDLEDELLPEEEEVKDQINAQVSKVLIANARQS